ncbi:monovalent cation/H+ antiporter complex subunit F [Desulfosarcina sp.]|uniref:monovalent cation/H+ antiporter complex subunit F n=1 Tax=Desulfosarcina sp. TaxID=2027861 RepID=UPI003561A135
MIIDGHTVVQIASQLALALLIVSMALAFIRLVRGPQAADRVVALDLISVLIVAFLAAYAVHAGDTSFLDVAIAYALVAFLGTVALARFLMRSRKPGQGPQKKVEP